MTKREYLYRAMQQDITWLKACAAHPSVYMRPIHVALIKIAVRRKSL